VHAPFKDVSQKSEADSIFSTMARAAAGISRALSRRAFSPLTHVGMARGFAARDTRRRWPALVWRPFGARRLTAKPEISRSDSPGRRSRAAAKAARREFGLRDP
jgi:hypothetical protein